MKILLKRIKNFIFSDKFALIIRITLIIAIIIGIYSKDWISVFFSFVTLGLSFFSIILEKRNLKIPKELEIIIIIFIFGALFLGDANAFYQKFDWWDSVHHFVSGIILGIIGFIIFYVFYKTGKIKTSIFIISALSLFFATTMSVIWEIYEFSVDVLLGLDSQESRNLINSEGVCESRLGVIDTMSDLILGFIGATIASIIGYVYLKKGESFFWFDYLVQKFEKQNKSLFKK